MEERKAGLTGEMRVEVLVDLKVAMRAVRMATKLVATKAVLKAKMKAVKLDLMMADLLAVWKVNLKVASKETRMVENLAERLDLNLAGSMVVMSDSKLAV